MEDVDARKTFDEQFVRSQRHIFRYIAALLPNRDHVEEVFQDTCLKMLEKWRDFDATRPMVPWACGIARNMVRKFAERNRNRGLFLSDAMIDAVSQVQHRLTAEADHRMERLPDCLQELTAEQRLLLSRCYGQDNSIKAVAQAGHVDPNTLYKRLERIRRSLFDCIERAPAKE
jgi:RNA polymerase sigma-70 factor (ECF subfamily)